MTIKADDRRRLLIPGIKPGQEFLFHKDQFGVVTLSPVAKSQERLYDQIRQEQIDLEEGTAKWQDGTDH